MKLPDLAWIKSLSLPDSPEFGARLYDTFKSIVTATGNTEQQGNLNPDGQPLPPPPVQAVAVTGQNGQFNIAIQHDTPDVRRGVRYYVEHADNPNFTDPHAIYLGDSRNHTVFLGNETRYWRAAAAYSSSAPSQWAYHGGDAPQPVEGGGDIGGPAFQQSQGSGTGAPGQGLSGPGPVPVRDKAAGYDWTLQRGVLGTGFTGQGTPAWIGASGGSDSPGGGGVSVQGLIVDTHANRLASYPSIRYPVNTEFYETDRTSVYWVKNASGTVTVTLGTAVTWVSGDHFINTGTGFTASQWPSGTPIVINGVVCRVSAVNSPTSITLTAATVNAVGVSFSVASGRWVYQSGQYAAALASIPTDLGENDTTLISTKVAVGFLFYENAAYAHQLQWNVSAWQRGPWDEEHSDTFHSFGSVPTDLGWQACDGTVGVTYLKYDGTTGTRTVPNLNATAAFEKGGGAYSSTITAKVVPTSNALTFTGSSANTSAVSAGTPSGTNSAPIFTGDAVAAATTNATPDLVAEDTTGTGVSPVTTATGTVSAPAFTGDALGAHQHTLTATGTINTPTISLPGDPVDNFPAIRMYRR